MEHFIVDMQTEKSKKYYFIREEVSQEIVLLPSQYLMHKMRAKGSPNTIKRSALVISYYLNYLSENQLTMEDVWNMKYEKQQEHFTDFLIWLKAGMHSKDEYTKKPYNETCNAYLKEVFRLYNFAEQQEGCEQSLKVLSDAQYIVRNSVGIRKILNRRSFHGYLKETGHIGRTIEQDKIVILLKACANCRDQVLLLLLAETGFRIGEILGNRYATDIDYENHLIYVNFREDNENDARAKNAEFRKAKVSDKVRDKTELVWDFSVKASEKMKQQIFQLLIHILENVKDPKDRRVRFLLPMQWMYQYCIKQGIVDIETIEQEEIEKLEEIVKQKVVNYKNSMQIVDNSRKILFMSGKQIHWHANVWYMERFHLAPERVNPCNPVNRLSFYQVENLNNRKLLQEYARYQIGITGLTIGNIRSQQNYVKKFLKYLGPDVCALDVTEKQIGAYFKEIQQQEIQAETVNRQILDITKFYEYLKIKKHIKAIPFHPEYYEQKVYPIHHDRSVDEDIYMEILHKLNLFPEELRLIFLHLWATGLRISEVCTLKGDAYYWDGEDAWIKVYQIKMKADKMIPVPFMLYEVMQQYIKKNHIHANDYVFQAEQGGAYRIGSFVKRFRTQCKKHKIADCEYVFKTHDYRHTLATQFYDDGVPIQTIRDYLGHVAEEMTKQYVDYMPKKIEKANDNYFDKPENNIALTITPKKRRYRHEKG